MNACSKKEDTDVNHPDVALFPSSFFPHLGGVEELTRQLAHEHVRRGAKPLVVTNRWPQNLPATEIIEGLSVRREPFLTPERQLRPLARFVLNGRAGPARLAADITAHGSHVIHVQCVSTNAYVARNIARKLGLPLVVSLQGELSMDADQVYQRSTVLPSLLGQLFREAAAITACSRHTLDEAIAFTGVDPGPRGHVVYNGVDLGEFSHIAPAKRQRPYVLAIGRHVPQKGFDVLLRAFARLHDRGALANHQLVLAGDGPQHNDLRMLSQRLGLDGLVDFVGRCDRAATAALFAGCAVFVLPSRHEPMGIVNLEAMAAERPVLATAVGGVPELVSDRQSGVLVRPDNDEDLAHELGVLLADPNLRAHMGRAGLERVQRFSWPSIADQYAEIYRSVLHTHGRPARAQMM
jgi:glycogen synthase